MNKRDLYRQRKSEKSESTAVRRQLQRKQLRCYWTLIPRLWPFGHVWSGGKCLNCGISEPYGM